MLKRRTVPILSIALTAASACTPADLAPPPPEPGGDRATDDSAVTGLVRGDGPVAPSPIGLVTTLQNVTITGKVGYNDLREFGRWSIRRKLATGTIAEQCPYSIDSDGDGVLEYCSDNYLGLYEARVLIRERDLAMGAGCYGGEVIGETTVAADGTYTWTGSVPENCADPTEVTPTVVVLVQLQFCSDIRCFGVEDPGTDGDNASSYVWGKYDPGATWTAPAAVAANSTLALPTWHFEDPSKAGASPADVTDLDAQAANVFASMVDVTRKAHLDYDLPFRADVWDDVVVKFPTLNTGSATGGAKVINIPAPGQSLGLRTPSRWFDGNVIFHEYGHTMYFRAFDPGVLGPTRGYDYGGNGSWQIHSKEWPETAMTEGWANFFARVSLDAVVNTTTERRCHGAWDDNGGNQLNYCVGVCADGHWYPESVTKALCDWYDGDDDDDLTRNGAGDYHDATVLTIWENLQGWAASPGAVTSDALDMCEYADYVVNDKHGGNAAWRTKIVDLLSNNSFDCGGLP